MPIEIKSPYPLWKLIRDSGDKGFQFLSQSLCGNQKTVKGGNTQVSFLTDIPLIELISSTPDRVGIVVWLDGERYREITAAVQEKRDANLEELP